MIQTTGKPPKFGVPDTCRQARGGAWRHEESHESPLKLRLFLTLAGISNASTVIAPPVKTMESIALIAIVGTMPARTPLQASELFDNRHLIATLNGDGKTLCQVTTGATRSFPNLARWTSLMSFR